MLENWRDIEGYEGYYQVSDMGRVKSLDRTLVDVTGRTFFKKGEILKLRTNRGGYMEVMLSRKGKQKCFLVHRLVAEAFIPNPQNKPCVDHINTNRTDNNVTNLKWCTTKENCNNEISKTHYRDSQLGKKNTMYGRCGKDNPNSIRVIQYKEDGSYVRIWNSTAETSKEGFNVAHVGGCCRKERNSMGGYKWRYYEDSKKEFSISKDHKSIILVGCGASNVFLALRLLEKDKDVRITMIEKGHDSDKKICPKEKLGYCVECKICAWNNSWGGAGSNTDSKLSLTSKVGGILPDIVGEDNMKRLIKYVYDTYNKFYDRELTIYGDNEEELKDIINVAKINGIEVVPQKITHLGTEGSREVYERFKKHILNSGRVNILFDTEIVNLIIDNNKVEGVIDSSGNIYYADKVVLGLGRSGGSFIKAMADKYKINYNNNGCDIGVRVETSDKIMDEINKKMYEGKMVGITPTFNTKCRTFCQNGSGFVTLERYSDIDINLANGHAYRDLKSTNTNFAILCSYEINGNNLAYMDTLARLSNILSGKGKILVQRYGDFIKGIPSTNEDIENSDFIKPTLQGYEAGDLSMVLPYKIYTDIKEFIDMLGSTIEGLKNDDMLLYSPEVKRYGTKVEVDDSLNTNIKDLYIIGDCSGITRGLMQSSCMGVYLAENIMEV